MESNEIPYWTDNEQKLWKAKSYTQGKDEQLVKWQSQVCSLPSQWVVVLVNTYHVFPDIVSYR